MTTSAERLKEERLRVGMSQEQLAQAVGMSKGTQTHYETGKRMPDLAYLAAVHVSRKTNSNFCAYFASLIVGAAHA
jgi:transcriptional regulator with XRE-family HTH domain